MARISVGIKAQRQKIKLDWLLNGLTGSWVQLQGRQHHGHLVPHFLRHDTSNTQQQYIQFNQRKNGFFIKSKGKFLYSAVSSPMDHSKRFTLYFPDRPVHPDTILASHLNFSVEWKNLPGVLAPQHWIQTRVLVVESPKLYPWALALYIFITLGLFYRNRI